MRTVWRHYVSCSLAGSPAPHAADAVSTPPRTFHLQLREDRHTHRQPLRNNFLAFNSVRFLHLDVIVTPAVSFGRLYDSQDSRALIGGGSLVAATASSTPSFTSRSYLLGYDLNTSTGEKITPVKMPNVGNGFEAMAYMNIFRILADCIHAFSKCILIFAIHRNRSAEGN